MTQRARITGKVEYREGDGPNMTIRPGLCEIEVTAQDVTIGWADGDSRGAASMPVADYQRHLANKAIQLIDPPAA